MFNQRLMQVITQGKAILRHDDEGNNIKRTHLAVESDNDDDDAFNDTEGSV